MQIAQTIVRFAQIETMILILKLCEKYDKSAPYVEINAKIILSQVKTRVGYWDHDQYFSAAT